MTIDERIEKLVERHEALAQSVELFHADMRAHELRLDKLTGIVETLADTVSKIVRVLELHERRIGGLEGD